MSPSIWRLAVAGCVLSAVYAAPACAAVGDSFAQPIQYLPKINLLQTVIHISNGLGKKDVEPNIISRTDKWRLIMAEAATVRPPRQYDPVQTKDYFDLRVISPFFTKEARLDCITGENMNRAERIWGSKPLPDVGMVCLNLLKVSADEQRDIAPLPAGETKRDPARDLLAPYREIQNMKGMVGTDKTALELVDGLNEFVVNNPNVRDSTTAVGFTLYSGQKAPFYASRGVVFDSRFTERVMDFIKNGALPPKPTVSRELLDDTTRRCYDPKTIVTNGQCFDAADGQAYHYLKPEVAQSRPSQVAGKR